VNTSSRQGGRQRERQGERLVALALLAVLAINPPLLVVFDRLHTVLGIPLLFLYLFAAWAVLIALIALIVERGTSPWTPTPSARRSSRD